ncbi:hypothetical protein BJF80_03180 [Serinicoccus sp. CUA-874]|nr:hypothetical protein BJF80_03180 [Serinicoccus sp. CUA-874]
MLGLEVVGRVGHGTHGAAGHPAMPRIARPGSDRPSEARERGAELRPEPEVLRPLVDVVRLAGRREALPEPARVEVVAVLATIAPYPMFTCVTGVPRRVR